MTYEEWIADRLKREDCWNKCDEWTAEMMDAFPGQLSRVRGYAWVGGMGQRPHWWLVTSEGEIVDPTASQFTDKPGSTIETGPDAGKPRTCYYGGAGIFDYEPVDESNPPIGRCMNCGETCYKLTATCNIICSVECDNSYRAYIQREIAGGRTA